MWLINTSTIKLERANSDDLPPTPYAILSHTWAEQEVTFEDMISHSQVKCMLGYTKIENTCRLAKERGLAYAWVDTCCIDKRSSAELAEAINSMFRWYKQATVCFAHLEDLPPGVNGSLDYASLSYCRWFTRGWTLQELIGPKDLEFYDCAWKLRGKKTDLGTLISEITGIHEEVLNDNSALESVPIARRMSWAAKRKTTRVEDMAYCLLGIFDVNMPMMYGEGAKAFERLQEEIIKQTTDMSIFAWKANDESQDYRGILAQSPDEFAHCGHISQAPSMRCGYETTMTNKGLRLETFLGGSNVLNLACTNLDSSYDKKRIGIFLTKTADGYVRSSPTTLFETTDSSLWAGARYKIFVRKRVTPFVSKQLKQDLANNLTVYFDICPGFQICSFAAKPADLWDQHRHAFIGNINQKFAGFLDFKISDKAGSFVSNRIIAVCSFYLRHPYGLKGSHGTWKAIYDSKGGPASDAIMECINGYYNSYGEEYYLSRLADAVIQREWDPLRGEWDLQPEVNLPSGNEGCHLCISSYLRMDPENGARSLVIKLSTLTLFLPSLPYLTQPLLHRYKFRSTTSQPFCAHLLYLITTTTEVYDCRHIYSVANAIATFTIPSDEAAVPAQADIVGIPGAVMTTLSLTQGLLRAVSADNVNPQAVIQMERLGSCFHSNGPWASRVPDLLCRASSVRLERLSAWIDWEKNDTASFMSKTTGGKTIR
uniref:Uncharacterized protein n=1 Tax=Gibberella zeae TaxID=5518 RepID=A0A4E9EGI3_GIBZA